MKVYSSDITVEEFIARHAKPYDPAADNYFREPFVQDTKVGKNSAITWQRFSDYSGVVTSRHTWWPALSLRAWPAAIKMRSRRLPLAS